MTTKELNAIKSAAYKEWAQGEEAKELFSKTNNTIFLVYEISEGNKVERVTLTQKSQMNDNLLNDHGFSNAATVTFLFSANRQTKTLNRYE